MPHCVIEITENIYNSDELDELMLNCANALNDTKIFNPNDIKVRCRIVKNSTLGIEIQNHSYVAVDVQVLDNKTENQYKEIGEKVFDVICNHFNDLVGKNSITLKITPIKPDLYFRKSDYNS